MVKALLWFGSDTHAPGDRRVVWRSVGSVGHRQQLPPGGRGAGPGGRSGRAEARGAFVRAHCVGRLAAALGPPAVSVRPAPLRRGSLRCRSRRLSAVSVPAKLPSSAVPSRSTQAARRRAPGVWTPAVIQALLWARASACWSGPAFVRARHRRPVTPVGGAARVVVAARVGWRARKALSRAGTRAPLPKRRGMGHDASHHKGDTGTTMGANIV